MFFLSGYFAHELKDNLNNKKDTSGMQTLCYRIEKDSRFKMKKWMGARVCVIYIKKNSKNFHHLDQTKAYLTPRNPCERAGWRSFRGKGPEDTEERGSRMIENTDA